MEAVVSPALPFGRYRIRERMAEGGMGEVFLAVAVGADGFEKPVVIKRLLPQFAGRADVASLLAREAKLMTRLIHPNIVQVIDFGRGQNDDYFLVMELVGGTDLGRFCRAHSDTQGAIPAPIALFIVSQMLRGLAYAHATASADGKRLVHRDISPGNVLLSTFGEVKIADFGVALVASSADTGGHDGWLVGKPAYMPPEQLAREAVDERADIYSVGAVLFQMLTGSPPGSAPDAAVPRELADVVARALAPRAEDRYASARDMSRAIEQLVEKGARLATADDLAEAVTAAAPREPLQKKAVLLLSTGERDGLASGTELRRSGDAAPGDGFTLKIKNDSAPPPAPSDGARSPDAPHAPSRARRWPLAIAAVSLAALAAWFVVRRTASPSSAAASPPLSALSAEPPPPASAEAAPDQPLALPSSGSPLRPGPVASHHATTRPKEAPASIAAQTAQPVPGCHGQVHIYATHGWIISGGPAAVQAPGRYDWPCGTYALRAVSRVDNHESRAVTVTVRDTVPGVVDLR